MFQLVPQIHNSTAGFKGFAGCAPYLDLGGIKRGSQKGKNNKNPESQIYGFKAVHICKCYQMTPSAISCPSILKKGDKTFEVKCVHNRLCVHNVHIEGRGDMKLIVFDIVIVILLFYVCGNSHTCEI